MNRIIKFISVFCTLSFFTLLIIPANAQNTAPNVVLSQNGQAMPVVISADASDREKVAAQTLADYLHRISGALFKVQTSIEVPSVDMPGIVVGSSFEIPELDKLFDLNDSTKREDYLLRSHAKGVLLIGASELAVEHAVWDFLYRLGYRQFFPGKVWEVIPRQDNLSIAVDTFEHPDYYSRRIYPGYGTLKKNRASYAEWVARNRLGSGIQLRTGHAYENIIRHHKVEFDKHPEYLTQPKGNKFCVSNPGLQQLVIEDALSQFEKDPSLQSVSVDPSDGGGWQSDSCPDATVYKSITDRVVTLANLVAQAVNEKYPGKYVGMYAYNEHSPPPTIDVNPHVVPSIATAYIRGGFTVDELLEGWHQKAQLLGMREYYSVNSWDRDLPGSARGANLKYLTTTIPHFYNEGARFMAAESSDNFGPNGLGYYIASRLLWNTKDVSNVDAIKADFFDKAFGPAKEPMQKYYQLIDGANKPLMSADLIGRMYRQLDKAWKTTSDRQVLGRIADLTFYTRYVELYSAYSQATGLARQEAFEALMRYTWRIRTTQMVHTLALWRDLPRRDKKVKFPEGSGYRTPEDKDPWKSNQAFTIAQLQQMIADGIANNKLIDFTPVSFSDDLVPATPLQLTSGKPGSFNMLRGSQDFYTWIEKIPATIDLQVRTGLIYSDRGSATVGIYPITNTNQEIPSYTKHEVPSSREFHDVHLETNQAGINIINVSDDTAGTILKWPDSTPMTVESSLETPTQFAGGRWTMYFYVPKGTKIIGGYRSAGVGSVKTPDDKTALTFTRDNNPGYWSIPVPAGQDGKLWQLYNVSGEVNLMTVPPYLARSADELLLPKVVVEMEVKK